MRGTPEERVVGAVEVEARVGSGERAGRRRREEGAHAGRTRGPAPWAMSKNGLMAGPEVGTLQRSRMTIEDHGRGAGGVPRASANRCAWPQERPRSTSRDLERYAGLFASRTRVMKSSAMRDMMAVTARPEVISLATGLPDTGSFRPTFAAMTQRIAAESCARALQCGPTEGLDETKGRIAEVMAAEGMEADADDVIVTTGGQQVIDLVTKTLIDPGDVVVAEAPTYPRAVPVFSSYQADVVQIEVDSDGMRVDLLEETLERLEQAEVHLHRAQLPEPGRGDDAAREAPPPRGDRARA